MAIILDTRDAARDNTGHLLWLQRHKLVNKSVGFVTYGEIVSYFYDGLPAVSHVALKRAQCNDNSNVIQCGLWPEI